MNFPSYLISIKNETWPPLSTIISRATTTITNKKTWSSIQRELFFK